MAPTLSNSPDGDLPGHGLSWWERDRFGRGGGGGGGGESWLALPYVLVEGTGTLSVQSPRVSDAIDAFQAMQLSLATNLELRATSSALPLYTLRCWLDDVVPGSQNVKFRFRVSLAPPALEVTYHRRSLDEPVQMKVKTRKQGKKADYATLAQIAAATLALPGAILAVTQMVQMAAKDTQAHLAQLEQQRSIRLEVTVCAEPTSPALKQQLETCLERMRASAMMREHSQRAAAAANPHTPPSATKPGAAHDVAGTPVGDSGPERPEDGPPRGHRPLDAVPPPGPPRSSQGDDEPRTGSNEPPP